MAYNLKNIFSFIQDAIIEKGHSPNSDFMISAEFLMNKSFSLADCTEPDLYFLIDFQEHGEIILEKNERLTLGLEKPSIQNIMSFIDQEYLK